MAAIALELLSSNAKLDRDKGVAGLDSILSGPHDEETARNIESSIQVMLGDRQAAWEKKHGALMGCRCLILLGQNRSLNDEFVFLARENAMRLVEDSESRVRLAAGELMGALCQKFGPEVYVSVKEKVLEGVKSNLERQPMSEADQEEQRRTEQLVEKLAGSQRDNKITDAEQIFHDTAGWKSLETWMKCLQCMIDGCASTFNPYIEQDLLELIFQALTHTNRFVRETGYYVCGSLVGCNYSPNGEMLVPIEENAIYRHGQAFAAQVAKGLADNWSQVRLASSVAARKFLLGLPSDDARSQFFGALLPPLCLNRYYVAEGVRIYNQQTWKMVTGDKGKELVALHIKAVVDFYISQTEADNHAVREAACACIAELGKKVSTDVVRPHVARLLDALIVCFMDESWPVRDASCVACGNFILCFPDEARSSMATLYPLFYENLQDNIPSVRQGAAVALTNVVKAYGEEALTGVLEKVSSGLVAVETQTANVEQYAGLDKGPATYGVVKRARDNDMDLHTDQQMYSCGSLAPKMHRGKRGGGCMDHQFKRPSEPWELADGCVWLLGELARLELAAPAVAKLLPALVTAANHRHYTQHVHLLETLCKQLPGIGKGVGKRAFKMHLESFFEPIFYSLSCDNALTASAASQCLSDISSLIGPNILRGRVEQYNPRYLDRLPELDAPFAPHGPFGGPPPLHIPGSAPAVGMAIPGAHSMLSPADFRPGDYNAPLGASPPATGGFSGGFFQPPFNG